MAVNDFNNQPTNLNFNAARLNDRAIDELIGLCKGVIADNVVTQSEAEFLQQWISDNRQVSDAWPANMIYKRVREMLQDGVLDSAEQKELLELLKDLTGGEHKAGSPSLSSSLPLCDPPPAISFAGETFCLTGKFVSGSRQKCEEAVTSRGGKTTKSPTKSTRYLIIGEVGSRDWIHSTHGRKIEKAIDLRSEGHDISIVSESHWLNSVTG